MIAKHIHCQPEHDQYGTLARYIAAAGHDGEKCLANWCAGCAAEDDYGLAILEAEAVQALNTRSTKEKTYHLMVSFRPEDEARLTPKTFKAIEERFAAALGFSEHQRHCGVHKNRRGSQKSDRCDSYSTSRGDHRCPSERIMPLRLKPRWP